ncbi:MAG: hypothetical protein ACLPTZ_13695 [Beijerinckiaceae bacterium]
MEGGYCYERKLRSAEIKTEPAKNRFSHLADSLEYMAIAMGEGRAMIGLTPANELKPTRVYRGHKTMRRVVMA